MTKTIVAIIILVIAVPLAIFFVKSGLERSKSDKTSLYGNISGKYRDDNLSWGKKKKR